MKKFIVVVFTVVIILLQFAGAAVALNMTEKIPDGHTEKMALTPLTDIGFNLPLPIVHPKKRSSLFEARYNTLKDVNENREEGNTQVAFSHFYQQISDSSGTAWNVSTVDILMFAKYISLGLTIDRGDLSGPSGKFWTTNMVHRFGLEIGQSYRNNDSTFFGVKFAKERYFPGFSFKMGYCWDLTPKIKSCFEIQGISFGPQQSYTALSLSFTKRNGENEFTVVPYCSVTERIKFNIMMIGKFYMQQKQSYLSICGVTGYFPNDNIFIDYKSIMKQRYLLSGEGMIKVRGIRPMFHPACGIDYLKGDDSRFRSNWFVKLGVVVRL